MQKRAYFLITGIIFAVISVLHLLRIIFSWDAVIGSVSVPLWVSWIALVVAAFLAWSAFKFN